MGEYTRIPYGLSKVVGLRTPPKGHSKSPPECWSVMDISYTSKIQNDVGNPLGLFCIRCHPCSSFSAEVRHYTVGIVDQRALFGQTLYMLQYQDKANLGLNRANVELTPEMINFAMREVVFPSKGDLAIICWQFVSLRP